MEEEPEPNPAAGATGPIRFRARVRGLPEALVLALPTPIQKENGCVP